MMKTVNRILSSVLALALLLSCAAPSYAKEDDHFVTLNIATLDENNSKTQREEVFYYDGDTLYAPTSFFGKYTAYYYDAENRAFVRNGQEYKLATSRIEIDTVKKSAKVKMLYSTKEISLKQTYSFGARQYLPLGQMLGLLKAQLHTEGQDLIWITQSGFSLADAAYGINPYGKNLHFTYNTVVNDIFANNDELFNLYCLHGYFSSTIFGLRFQNLDIIFKSGNKSYYKDILTEIVTDTENYLRLQADPNSFAAKAAQADEALSGINYYLSGGKDLTNAQLAAYAAFTNTSDISDIDIEYIHIKEWNGVFKTLSKVKGWYSYGLKMVSMTEDHRQALEDCNNDRNKIINDTTMTDAVNTVYREFGQESKTANLCNRILDEFAADLTGEAISGLIDSSIPVTKMIKAVNTGFKIIFNYDLSNNLQYSILLETLLNSELLYRFDSYQHSAGETQEASERFRRSAILWLLAEKHAFTSGNALDKRLKGTGKLFDSNLDSINVRLNLFYLAAESAPYDSIAQSIAHADLNEEAIDEIDIDALKESGSPKSSYTQEEYLQFFEDKILPLIESAPHQIHDLHGYAGAFPFNATGKNTDSAYLNLYWNTVLQAYSSDRSAYDKYEKSYVSDAFAAAYGEGKVPAVSSAPGISTHDLENVRRIEKAASDAGTARDIWTVMDRPELLQAAIDSICGANRQDITKLMDSYRSNGVPLSFVGDDGSLWYLTLDGAGGDISDYHAVYKVTKTDIQADKATFTFNIFYVNTLDGTNDYQIIQRVKAADKNAYLQKAKKNPAYDASFTQERITGISEWPCYFDNTLAAGMISSEKHERLKNGSFDEILLLTGLRESVLEPVEITFYNTDDGIRVYDINCPDTPAGTTENNNTDTDHTTTAPATDYTAAYQDYIRSAFDGNCTVSAIADVTMDGFPELIIVNDTGNDIDGYVFTFRNNSVELLEEKNGGRSHVDGGFSWFITPNGQGGYFLMEPTSVIYQGRGHMGYTVYSLSDDGTRTVDRGYEISTDDPAFTDAEGFFTDQAIREYREILAQELQSAYKLYDFSQEDNGYASPLPAELEWPLQ